MGEELGGAAVTTGELQFYSLACSVDLGSQERGMGIDIDSRKDRDRKSPIEGIGQCGGEIRREQIDVELQGARGIETK
jgi:hypothetical protein